MTSSKVTRQLKHNWVNVFPIKQLFFNYSSKVLETSGIHLYITSLF